ncbi:hypothetical protein ZIOFF_057609 [Zingiber officinale]|uniref:Uncharacterized protein n=1 Tax=Zingiber officinale TaxID=94328 RepID=A0A8J5F7U1_ZINOF|nr:hypothetical protein ZIOFF_057609 [Zingiber officinale]
MAEWLASSFIGRLTDKICSYAGNQYEHQSYDTEEKIKQLGSKAKMIKDLIHAAEASQTSNLIFADYILRLKNEFYVLDDIFDKFDYRKMEEKVRNRNKSQAAHGFFQWRLLNHAAKHAQVVINRLCFSDQDLNDLLEATRMLDNVHSEMSNLTKLVQSDLAPRSDDSLEWRITTSISGTKLFGRDNEKESLVKLLLQPFDATSSSSRNFSVISIVGVGGVGKTSLAQAAFNDPAVMARFTTKVWACAHRFDLKSMSIEILAEASSRRQENFHNLRSLEKIQLSLMKHLRGKRFLIVLDDVWNEASGKWEMLSRSFQSAKQGSIVLITTRNQRISDMMEAKESMKLEGLGNKDFLPFFMNCAFGCHNPGHYPKLLQLGQQIARKMGGSPLAAKTVGGALKSNLEEDHWRRILASKLWQLHQNEYDIVPALRLSYEQLPKHLKQCFAYCSIFPKNHCFEKDSLVQMWMALGFVQPDGQRRLEDIAGEYIDDLSSRFFFQNAAGRSNRFAIHDLLHDVGESVSTKDHFKLENETSEIPRSVNHLSSNATHLKKVYEFAHEMKNLRSLVVFGEKPLARPAFVELFEEVLKQLKGLRIVVLHDLPVTQLPEAIGNLVHLRYLEIQSSHAVEFPNFLYKLYHLQGLKIKIKMLSSVNSYGWSPKAHPAAIGDLINLRYLRISPESLYAIPGIGSLTLLQDLEQFHARKSSGFQIKELGNLRQLHGEICIKNLDNVRSKKHAQEARLCNKEHLRKLSLYWNYHRQGCPSTWEYEEVLEGLQPHQNLIELKIRRYMGIRSPSWMQTSNLEYIELSHCNRWKLLPSLGQLPFLRFLHMRSMAELEELGAQFYGDNGTAFESLEELKIEDMPELKEWSYSSIEPSCNLFPRLTKLHIRNCPKLRGPIPTPTLPKEIALLLSDKITPIANDKNKLCKRQDSRLVLTTDRIWRVAQCIPEASLGFIHWLEMSSSFLVTFTAEQEEWLQQLSYLRHLSFSECNNMTCLPAVLKSITSLETLHIKKCPEVKSLPQNGLPGGLKEIHINACHRELKQRCSWSGADGHKISHDQGQPLPKFGEWDVNNPASAEGFTVIFNKARDEKKTGGNSGAAATPSRNEGLQPDIGDHHPSKTV